MLSNKTIELIRKSLDLSIANAIFSETALDFKKAKDEFNEFICDMEDTKDNE